MAYSASPIASVSVSGFSSSFTGLSASIDTTGADLLIAVCVGTGTFTFQDSAVNTWTQAASYADGSGRTVKIYYKQAPTTSATHGFQLFAGAPACSVTAWTGSVASPLDQTSAGASANSSSASAGSQTPSQANDLVIIGCGCEGTTNPPASSIDGSFTLQNNRPGVAATCYAVMDAYLVQTSAAAANPTITLGSSQRNFAISASFKAAGGGATSIVRQMMQYGA